MLLVICAGANAAAAAGAGANGEGDGASSSASSLTRYLRATVDGGSSPRAGDARFGVVTRAPLAIVAGAWASGGASGGDGGPNGGTSVSLRTDALADDAESLAADCRRARRSISSGCVRMMLRDTKQTKKGNGQR